MQALSWIREFPWGTEMRKHEEKDGVRNGGHGQGSTVQRLKVHENTKYTHAWKQEVERFWTALVASPPIPPVMHNHAIFSWCSLVKNIQCMESPWTRVYETVTFDSIKWPLRIPLHKTKVPSHGHVCSRATGLMFHLSMFPFTCQVLPIYFARLPRLIARLLQRGHDRPELRRFAQALQTLQVKIAQKASVFQCFSLPLLRLRDASDWRVACFLLFSDVFCSWEAVSARTVTP